MRWVLSKMRRVMRFMRYAVCDEQFAMSICSRHIDRHLNKGQKIKLQGTVSNEL